MKHRILFASVAVLAGYTIAGCGTTKANSYDRGFISLFDGKTLTDWEGDSTYWRVEDGSIVGEVTPATLLKRNSFLIWRGGRVSDFELKAAYKVSPRGNSGINYRSEELDGIRYALSGYQADIDGEQRYTGSNYEEGRRTTLASRGSRVVLPPIAPDGADGNLSGLVRNNQWTGSQITGTLGHPDSLAKVVKPDDWNEYHLVVRGNHLQHYVNGVLMSDVTDNDTVNRRMEGLLGVQVHVGPPMKIAYKNIRLKRFN